MADPSAPDATMACPTCAATLPADALFCLRCGARQVQRPPAAGVSAVPEVRGVTPTVLGISGDAALVEPPSSSVTAQGFAVQPEPAMVPPRTVTDRGLPGLPLAEPPTAEAQPTAAVPVAVVVAPPPEAPLPVVTAPPPEASPAPPPPVAAATPTPEAPVATEVAAAAVALPTEAVAAPVVRSVNKTMMGVATDEFRALAAAGVTPAAPAPAAAPAPGAGGTFHGVAPSVALPQAAVAASAPVVVPPNSGRTMMGVVLTPPVAGATLPAPGVVAPAPARVPSPVPPPAPEEGAGTIQGFAPAPHARPRREPPPMMGGATPGVPPTTLKPVFGEQRPGAVSHRTQGQPSPRSLRAHKVTERLVTESDDDDIVIPGLTPARKRTKGTGGTRSNVVAFGVLAVVSTVLAVAAIWAFRHRPASVEVLPATVRAAQGGLAIGVRFTGAPAGSKVRYRTVETAVQPDGAAEFIAADLDRRVGVIDLPIELVTAAGVARQITARIFVGYRVEPDFSHLGDDPARVHLEFRVPHGAGLWVAEQPIQVVGDRGIADIPAPAPIRVNGPEQSSRDRYAIRVRTTDGVEVRGEYELRIPRTALRVDSPPPISVTTSATQVVRARATTATRALVGGQAVAVQGQALSATVNLVRGRNEIDVVVFAPNGAPASSPVVVYRDATPQSYLGSNPGGVDAVLGDNPPPGVHVRLNGVVVQRSVAGAEAGVFQIVVDDRRCPQSRCGVLVAPAAPTSVTEGQRVEIVGETSGVRTYATATDARRTVALVTALFVTPR